MLKRWDPSHIQTRSGVHKTQNNNNFKTVSIPDDMMVLNQTKFYKLLNRD